MRKVNNVDLAGLNDFFDTAQANMKKNAALPSHKPTDDIIRMAREAGWDLEWGSTTIEQVQNFAALVAAAEREACALVCEAIPATWTRMDYDEACMECAKAIRARGGE